jgi:hypothetical protein
MIRILAAFLAFSIACVTGAVAQTTTISVDGNVALSSLISLADNHIADMANTLETLAKTPAAASGDWSQIEPSLKEAAAVNVPAVVFYAAADGTYWTVSGGKQTATLSDRAYFKRALAGQRTIGELLASRSTGKAVAIVAIPIVGANGAITGAFGGSIYVDQLSTLLVNEMHVGAGMVFWALDQHGVIALHSDTSNVFVEPAKMSPALQRVTAHMLAHESGQETYAYRGQTRTILYRKSPLTGWTYGFGVTH